MIKGLARPMLFLRAIPVQRSNCPLSSVLLR